MTTPPDDISPIFEAACDLQDAGELEGAAAIFRQVAEAGDVYARVRLADVLDDLNRPAEAVRWYRRAVRDGHPLGALNLAVLYRNRNRRARYIRWLRVAAAMGDDEAPGLLETATTQDHVWWAMEGVEPPPFARGLRLVRD